jgi:hypothetical protein
MKSARFAWVGVSAVLLLSIVWMGATRTLAQNSDWEVTRAEYGGRGRRVEVTDRVLRLLWEAQRSGRAPVSNETMGGDPAPGVGKTLHIWARNWRNEEREFEYKEGGSIDVAVFRVRELRDERSGDRPEYRDDRRRDDDECWCREGRWRGERGLRVLRAYYGHGGRTVNVTELLRQQVRGDSLRIEVNNQTMGGDPAPEREKVLIVIYRFDGQESAASVKEGNALRVP